MSSVQSSNRTDRHVLLGSPGRREALHHHRDDLACNVALSGSTWEAEPQINNSSEDTALLTIKSMIMFINHSLKAMALQVCLAQTAPHKIGPSAIDSFAQVGALDYNPARVAARPDPVEMPTWQTHTDRLARQANLDAAPCCELDHRRLNDEAHFDHPPTSSSSPRRDFRRASAQGVQRTVNRSQERHWHLNGASLTYRTRTAFLPSSPPSFSLLSSSSDACTGKDADTGDERDCTISSKTIGRKTHRKQLQPLRKTSWNEYGAGKETAATGMVPLRIHPYESVWSRRENIRSQTLAITLKAVRNPLLRSQWATLRTRSGAQLPGQTPPPPRQSRRGPLSADRLL